MNSNIHEESERSIDLIVIFNLLVRKWYVLLISAIIGIGVALYISFTLSPEFNVKSSVLIKSDMKYGDVDVIFDRFDYNNNINVQNSIAIFKSYHLIKESLEQLRWRTKWFKEGLCRDDILYKSCPFVLEIPENGKKIILSDLTFDLNPPNIRLYITPVNQEIYNLKVYQEIYSKEGNKILIDINENITYGSLFNKSVFNFIINKKFNPLQCNYSFEFINYSDLAIEYSKKLQISLSDKKSEILLLSVKGESPLREVDFLNTLIDVYRKWGLKQKNIASENIVHFIDGQMKNVVDSLRKASLEFSDFRSNNSTLNLDKKAEMISKSYNKIEADLFTSKMQLKYFFNIKNSIKKDNISNDLVSPSIVGIVDNSLNALLIKLSELFSKRSILLSVSKVNNPSIETINTEIRLIRRSVYKNLENLINNTKINIKSLKLRKAEILNLLKKLPIIDQKLIDIKRNFDLNNELYTFLQKRRAEAAIKMASNVSDLKIIDSACIETASKIGPNIKIYILVGAFLGLLFPIGIILLRYFMFDYITSRKDLEESCTLPLYGLVNYEQELNKRWIFDDPRSVMAECFRKVKAQLKFGLMKGNVISIHSVIPREGKSHVSSNIASIFALGGARVVIVGADLRTPRLHEQFRLNADYEGVAGYLIGNLTYEDLILSTECENLYVALAGLRDVPNPAELLESEKFEDLILRLKNDFDYVIIDNAPVSLVADGLIVSKYSDMNLFVIRQNYSTHIGLRYIENLTKKGIVKNVGLIMNGMKNESYAGGYRYYKSYDSYSYFNKNNKRTFKSIFKKLLSRLKI